jgi:hypothetical protein
MRTPTGKQILELNYYPGTSKFHQDYVCRSELDRLGFYVRNVREQYERLVGLGCEPAVEPFNQGSWVLAFVKDPNGIWLELIGRESRKKYSTLKTVHPYSMFSSRSERGWLRRTCLARAWHRGVVRTVSRSHRKLFFCVQYTAL